MLVLGIDPGYAIVGCGAVSYERGRFALIEAGAITTPPKVPFEARLEAIYRDICTLLERVRPDAMAIEELFFSQNKTTGIYVAHARGVILLAAAQYGVEPFEYNPMQVKQAVVGYGNAEKRQVMDMTRRLLCLEDCPKPDDVADALAVAICHAHSASVSTLRRAVLNDNNRRSR